MFGRRVTPVGPSDTQTHRAAVFDATGDVFATNSNSSTDRSTKGVQRAIRVAVGSLTVQTTPDAASRRTQWTLVATNRPSARTTKPHSDTIGIALNSAAQSTAEQVAPLLQVQLVH